jgi:hypothetical protein
MDGLNMSKIIVWMHDICMCQESVLVEWTDHGEGVIHQPIQWFAAVGLFVHLVTIETCTIYTFR